VTLPVAILAGGLATRLRPITESIPKALVEIAGKPFIVHQLALLHDAGVRRVVLCVGYLGEQVRDTLGDRFADIDLAYSFDGGQLLGTGGALRRALPLLGDRFLVLYGDSYLRCDYVAIANAFIASGKLGLMTVYKNDGKYDASNVSYRDGHIVRYDKTPGVEGLTHIDYGLGALRAESVASYPDGQRFDLVTLYQDLLARGELAGYEVTERFYEIGSPSGLADTRELLEKP
jgi:N-acetyl-alpha-D-muramate 1-phosphate uridylyltransferase